MADISENISNLKEQLPEITPTPPDFHREATPHELKSRLNWGEPALTILDLRDYESYRRCRIMGAMQVPMEELTSWCQSRLEYNREIYLYSNSDQETAQAADELRQAGFKKVAQLQGGVPAWRKIGGSIEGIAIDQPPRADDYNVVSRTQQAEKEHAKEEEMANTTQ